MAVQRKIIIYGGAFDPPHAGHLALLRAAAAQLRPDRLFVVPGYRSPFKDRLCAPYPDRAAMLRACLAGTRAEVHPFEYRRRRVTYTWQTVAHFRKLHPGAELYFLMGSDCVETFHRWKRYRRILAGAKLLVGRRAGFGFRNPARAPYRLLKGRFPEIASTELKAALFAGRTPPGLPRAAAAYIGRKGLYLGALRRRLRAALPPGRYAHSLAVAALAAELAARHGADARKAALAGLLHDAARDLPPRALARLAALSRPRPPRLRDILRRAPVLLHSYAGAALAERRYGVKDRSVLNAIRKHTLGETRPDALSRILFVADLGAAGRDFPEAAEVAALARRDLGAAYRRANYVKLDYAASAGGWRHPESEKVCRSLKARGKG